ncbi:MAG TPA: ABC transporter permease [Candidatus Acidoferrales bacterium]|nr:ABC transporter permease [Candidatus Acidoferrales bacterium]
MSRILAIRLAIIAIAIALWETLARAHAFGPTLSVPPTVMFMTMIEALADGRLLPDVGRTLVEVALAYAIALVVGLPLGVVLWRSRVLATAIEPYLLAYYVIPLFAFYPLFIKIFGAGITPIVAIGVINGIGAIAMNVLVGLREIPRVQLALARSLMLRPIQTLVHVIIPATVPQAFVGLRLGFIYALIGVIAAEFILATAGVGYRIAFSYNNFESKMMFATILLVLIASIVCNQMLISIERRLGRYRRA